MKRLALLLLIGLSTSRVALTQTLTRTDATRPIRQGVMRSGLRQRQPSRAAPGPLEGVCASGTTVEGVDVSRYDGAVIWSQVSASGKSFAFTEFNDGLGGVDPQFDTNWAGIQVAGMARGAYQFFEPGEDAVAQANLLLAHLSTLGPSDLPPMLDVEAAEGQSIATVVNGVSQWVARIKQVMGVTPIIYTYASFWNLIGNPDFSADPLWVANWGVTCPTLPTGWANWNIWQYSDNGSVPGINGSANSTDLDKFNGALPSGTAPTFTTQPSNQTVNAGGTATFAVVASGSPVPTFQWQVSTNGGTTWANLTDAAPYSGTATATLTVTSATVSLNAFVYRAVATNTVSSTPSTAATLTVRGVVSATLPSLIFGATKAGPGGAVTAVTPAQTVIVSFSGTRSSWTASANQPWVQVTSGAGSGGGAFTVAITNPSNVIGGSSSLSATITLTAPAASNPSLAIPVSLTVDQTNVSTVPPFGQVDTPAQNTTGIQGALAVTGWAVDDVGVASVKIYRNCFNFDIQANCTSVAGDTVVYVGEATIVAGARPDVEAAYPTYPASNTFGWGFLILTNLLPDVPNANPNGGGQGTFTFYVYATDMEGHITRLGRSINDSTPTTATMADDTIAKPFGAIDTPTQGGTAAGTTFANFGWVLTPDPGTGVIMPTDGSTINVFVDGAPIGSVSYNNCRGTVGNPVPTGLYCNDDVSSIFGNASAQPTFTTRTSNPSRFRNLDASRGPIGALVFDTTTLVNGVHTIAWGVIDSVGRAEGIGSRYFTVINPGAVPFPDRAALEDASSPSRGSASSLDGVLPAMTHVVGRAGFDLTTPFESIVPTADGSLVVQIPELGRIELSLGSAMDAAYLVANGDLRGLPSGSHLDSATGQFAWAPGPGYLLAFLHDGQQIPVDITVRPMTSVAVGTSQIRMNVDLPTDGATVHGPVTLAGWALDPQAWTGSGIGAVHVWAFRRDAPTTGPQFLGTATLGLARPDVATAFGAQFGGPGFSLTTSTLAPGEYDVVAYAWCERTQQFEDARTVRVTVR
jgi:GH25 family lysozyme M1 (1,4-beta-N-acetylmuramidase)